MLARTMIATAGLLAGAALAPSATSESQPAGGTPASPIGVVRIADVMNRFRQTEDLETVFRERRMQFDAENQKRQEALKGRVEELARFKPETPERLARERDLLRLQAEYEVHARLTAAEMDRQQRVWMLRVYREVNAAAAAEARAQNLELVVAYRSPEFDAPDVGTLKRQIVQREILYARDTIDVSGAVLDRINADYARRGGIRTIRARLDPLTTP